MRYLRVIEIQINAGYRIPRIQKHRFSRFDLSRKAVIIIVSCLANTGSHAKHKHTCRKKSQSFFPLFHTSALFSSFCLMYTAVYRLQ